MLQIVEDFVDFACHPITIFQMTKHKPKNKTGAVQTRLGQDYPTFSAAAKKAGMSRDKLARIILKDCAAKIMSGEIVVESEPRIVKPWPRANA